MLQIATIFTEHVYCPADLSCPEEDVYLLYINCYITHLGGVSVGGWKTGRDLLGGSQTNAMSVGRRGLCIL